MQFLKKLMAKPLKKPLRGYQAIVAWLLQRETISNQARRNALMIAAQDRHHEIERLLRPLLDA